MTKKAKDAKAWPREGTMGAVIVAQLLKGKSTEQVIAAVREKWARARASLTPGGIGWWRAEAKAHGLKLPEAKAVKASRKAMKKATRAAARPNRAANAEQRVAA